MQEKKFRPTPQFAPVEQKLELPEIQVPVLEEEPPQPELYSCPYCGGTHLRFR